MKTTIGLFIVFVATANLYAQNNNYIEIQNSLEIDIGVQKTLYDRDSIKSYGYLYLCAGCKAKTNYFNSIRVDIIATDKTKNDTIFLKTLDFRSKETIELEIKEGVNEIDQELITKPFLMLSDGYSSYFYKLDDTLNLKLDNGLKVQGRLINYNDSNLTIYNYNNQKIKVDASNLIGIKNCGYFFYIGAGHSCIRICRYNKMKNLKFSLLTQSLNEDNYWEWKPIE